MQITFVLANFMYVSMLASSTADPGYIGDQR